jgi:uncharacterized protein
MSLLFEWDEAKAHSNYLKHKISFDEAKTIFFDPFLVTYPDDAHSDNEDRLISIGLSARQRVLLAVHIERGDVIRIISCRKATAREKAYYEQ